MAGTNAAPPAASDRRSPFAELVQPLLDELGVDMLDAPPFVYLALWQYQNRGLCLAVAGLLVRYRDLTASGRELFDRLWDDFVDSRGGYLNNEPALAHAAMLIDAAEALAGAS